MAEFYRVRDRETGHEYTTAVLLPDVHIVLDEPAVDADGRTIPDKPNPNPGPVTEPEAIPGEELAGTEASESGVEGNDSSKDSEPPTGRAGRRSQPSSQQTDQQTAQGGSTNTGGN